jgi:glucose/arabinose dehydrogenase
MKRAFASTIALLVGGMNALSLAQDKSDARGPNVPAFTVRDGYRVTLAVEKMSETRFMEFDDKGTLYVSQPNAGKIVALKDKDVDGVYETSSDFTPGKLAKVHGMHFKDGWLWFSQSTGIHKAQDKNADGVADEVVAVIPEGTLPGTTGHWWRSIFVVEDGFFTAVGDGSNASDQSDTDRQKIWKYDLNGQNKKLFSSGVRNTEKLRYRPGTDELWGVDHNSDNFGQALGEDPKKNIIPVTEMFPPEELNHYVEGGFYGHPFLVGNRVPRIEFQKHPNLLELAARTTVPALQLGPHWAGNGWCWITKDHFAADHKGDMFVAFHGSWNSTTKVGYRVERIFFDKQTGKPYGNLPIVQTLAADGTTVLARPVDCVEARDGSVLFSCDQTRRIYRITKK